LQRAGFGILPKQSFRKLLSEMAVAGESKRKACPFGKVRDRETRSPARVTRALPNLDMSPRSKVSQLTTPRAQRK
jgi:hypothetical protein